MTQFLSAFLTPFPLVSFAAGTLLLVAASVLRMGRKQPLTLDRTLRIHLTCCGSGCLAGVALVTSYVHIERALAAPIERQETSADAMAVVSIGPRLPEGVELSSVQLLHPGDPFPVSTVKHWIGPQEQIVLSTPPVLTVIDIWSQWCPYVSETAPELIAVYEKYRNQGVRFISLTSSDAFTADQFCQDHEIPWATGFEMNVQTAVDLGVYFPGAPMSMETPIAPTLYLIDQKGIVRWCNKSARVQHTDGPVTAQMLDDAIAEELRLLQESNAEPAPLLPNPR